MVNKEEIELLKDVISILVNLEIKMEEKENFLKAWNTLHKIKNKKYMNLKDEN